MKRPEDPTVQPRKLRSRIPGASLPRPGRCFCSSSSLTAQVTCQDSASLGYIYSQVSGNDPGWIQQTPGQVPRTLIYRTSSHLSGVPSRFFRSISGNKAALTIMGAQPKDEADYYCALDMGSGSYTATVM
ncbi:Ig lambda chain V region 4A precursor-like protein [Camelus ferus]|nr:Ig lambda chain V region 4A precursor-like protein [Camelus ferus]